MIHGGNMTEYELVFQFQSVKDKLNEMGYRISVIQNGFYIHNSKGTIVADTKTIDGLRGFMQGIEWSDATIAAALA